MTDGGASFRQSGRTAGSTSPGGSASPGPARPAGPASAGSVDTADSSYPERARSARTVDELDRLVVDCRACPRLVEWRERVAEVKRAAFRDETYWARPAPGFGDPHARVLVVGLAPAAHGANRTGRMFTGDRSGDFLFAALHRTGFASQPTSIRADDGMTLTGLRLTAPVRCAPPENAPTPAERRTCGPWLGRELELVAPDVIVVLGAFGWRALLVTLGEQGWHVPRPRPAFGHGAEVRLDGPDGRAVVLLGCFHVSPHNTFTGRLTDSMLDAVLERSRDIADAVGIGQAAESEAP